MDCYKTEKLVWKIFYNDLVVTDPMKNNMPQLFHLLQGGVEVAVVHQHLYTVLQDHTMYHKKGGIPEQIQITRNLEKVEVWKTIFSNFSTEPTLILTKIKQPPTDLQPLGFKLILGILRNFVTSFS